MDDFYLEEKDIAPYFEAQWWDMFVQYGSARIHPGASTIPFDFIQTQFFTQSAQWICRHLQHAGVTPFSMLEIGPALGRTCFELVQALPSLEEITVVEPSQILLRHFRKLLIDGGRQPFFTIPKLSADETQSINASPIADACTHIEFFCIDEPINTATTIGAFDLSIGLNVLDQCESPLTIVQTLVDSTRAGGLVVLACTYQWQKKYLKDWSEGRADINDYFPASWQKIDETHLEYHFRVNARYAMKFLSHLAMYRKT
jgi:hypothetical protein